MAKYTKHYTILWHDTDANREVRPSRLITYMQETANYQFRDMGMTLDQLRDEKGLAFLLSRMTVCFYKPLCAYDEIDVISWVCEARGLSCNRCFSVERNGEVVAEAFTVWGLMDLNAKKLLPASEGFFGMEPYPALTLSAPLRLHIPSSAPLEYAGERSIAYSELDYNFHMNNTNYADFVCNFLPDVHAKQVKAIVLSFLHEAHFAHTIRVFRYVDEENKVAYFRTQDESGTTCLEAQLFFEEKQNFAKEIVL